MFCVVLFGLITNLLFVVSVVKTPSLHTTTYILLTGLACSDCGILVTRTALILPALVDGSDLLPTGFTTLNTGSKVSECIYALCFLLSTGFVILVSVERYMAICHPLTHLRLKGTERTIKSIVILFMASAVIAGLFVPIAFLDSVMRLCILWPVGNEYHNYPLQMLIPYSNPWYKVYIDIYNWSLFVIYFLTLGIVSYMYAKIILTLGKRKRNTSLQMSAEFKKHIEQVSVMVIVNGVVYFLLTSIFITYLVHITLLDTINQRYWQVTIFASSCVNSSMNPLLYFFTNQRYRFAVKTLFRKCFKVSDEVQNKLQLDSQNVAKHRLKTTQL